jgi:hypothetical protein
VRRIPPSFIVVGLGLGLSAFLSLTFGWVGTLLLNMPGFMVATVIEGHNVSHFGHFIFLGNLIFYTTIFFGVQQLYRRFHGDSER